ncbi:MAG: UDP-3-O-(3-hydroxymyristoyl)glucosamine N-acyltransferase [Pseudomonadota bacterium]
MGATRPGIAIGELAAQFGCELIGDPDARVGHVATLANAGPGTLAFLANPKYRPKLAQCAASAVVLSAEDAAGCATNALITDDPYVTYARIATVLHPSTGHAPGIHAAASCDPTAEIHPTAHVAPGAVIEAGAEVCEGAFIGPQCVVGRHARVGPHSVLTANVTVAHHCEIGARVTLHPASVIGSDGFGYARAAEGWLKVPQVGRVVLGDDVDVGAGTTIDRGAVEDTVIGHGVKLDNQIQIGHNVRIGDHTIVAACSGVSGSTVIGKRCLVAGAVGFVGHLNICDDVTVTGQTMVNRSIDKPGVYSSALPMDEAARWRRNSARFRRLDDLARTVKRLEKAVASIGESAATTPDREGDD